MFVKYLQWYKAQSCHWRNPCLLLFFVLFPSIQTLQAATRGVTMETGAQKLLEPQKSADQQNAEGACIRYRFEAGDSVVYNLEAIDTIQFIDAPWLIKHREETWAIVCDFTDQLGRMYLRTMLLSAHAQEQQEGDSSVHSHKGSAWIRRMNFLVLDSNGRRIMARQADTIHAALCPGGAFSPPLLLDLFDTSCHSRAREGWNIDSEDSLVENGFPSPRIRQYFNCKIVDTTIDNIPCASIQFGQTSQASHTLLTKNIGVYTRCVMNGWGSTVISRVDGKPLVMHCSQDIKLWVKTEKDEQRGEQHSHTTYTRLFSGSAHPRVR